MKRPDTAGPLARYQTLTESGHLRHDPDQEAVARQLQDIFDRVRRYRPGWLDRWRKRWPPVRGAYLVGGVGRGKTMLMDLLVEALEEDGEPVQRTHFHRFMAHAHERLRHYGDRRDPLISVGRELAARARVLCFDEFHVTDIGDAMILGGLLEVLFERGVVLVTTSNTRPADLYADGLQRERFVPAIEAIERHCRVVSLDGAEDYRLRELVRHPVYHHPADEAATRELRDEFEALAAGERSSTAPIEIRGRSLQPVRRAGSVAWFEFETLCEGPRAADDYIELSRRFSTLIISDIPQLGNDDNDAARRLIHLVDECYDRSVKLLVSAAVPPEALYTGNRLAAPFERTTSRLVEMQSKDYLGREHRA